MYSSFVSELVNSRIRPKLYACKDRYFTLEQHYISIEEDINQGVSLSLSCTRQMGIIAPLRILSHSFTK